MWSYALRLCPTNLGLACSIVRPPGRCANLGYRLRGLPMRAIVGFGSLKPFPPHHSHILSRPGSRLGTRPLPSHLMQRGRSMISLRGTPSM